MGSAQGIRAGLAYVELYANDNALVKGLNAASAKLKAFGNALKAVGFGLSALGAGIITPILASAKSFAETGDALQEMSQRTGIAAETLSELSYAATQSGTSLGDVESALRHVQKIVVDASDGSADAVDALRQLGLSAGALKDLAPVDQFEVIAKGIGGIQDPTRRSAAAMKFFGRSIGTSVLPLMNDLDALREEAHAVGAVMSEEDVAAAAELSSVMKALKAALQGIVNAIGSAVAPILTEYGTYLVRILATTSQWIRDNKAIVVTVLKVGAAIAVAGAAFLAAGYGLTLLGTVFSTIATVMTTGVSLVTGLFGFAASAFSAVVAAVTTGAGIITGVLGFLWSTFLTVFGVIAAITGASVTPIGIVAAAILGLVIALQVLPSIAQQVASAFSETLTGLWILAQQVFGEIKSFALTCFTGIRDALAAGDIALAAEILWLSLKVVWKKGIAVLTAYWIEFTTDLKEAWINWSYDFEAALVQIGNFFESTFDAVVGFFYKIWNEAVGWLAKKFAWAMSFFDSSLDLGAVNQQIDNQTKSNSANRDAEAKSRADVRSGALAIVATDRDAELTRIEAAKNKDLADAQSDLEQTRAEWLAAIAQAKDERAAAEAPALKKIQTSVTPEMEKVTKGDVIGTFNASAVGQLGIGNSVGERIAKACERTALNTDPKNSGDTFAP